MIDADLRARISALIGNAVLYQGEIYQVIEFMPAELTLVLQHTGMARVIQPNQFGDASRRVQEIINLPLFETDGDTLNPVIGDWLRQHA